MSEQTISIAALKKQLAEQKELLASLESQRASLLTQLAAVEKQIAKVSGKSKPGRKPGKKPGRKPGRKQAAKKVVEKAVKKIVKKAVKKIVKKAKASKPRGRRAKGSDGGTLTTHVAKALDGSKGMRVKEILSAVEAGGYKSSSKDFYNIIAAALRNKKVFAKVKRGVYKLK